jgi:hypothetical protein
MLSFVVNLMVFGIQLVLANVGWLLRKHLIIDNQLLYYYYFKVLKNLPNFFQFSITYLDDPIIISVSYRS